MFLSLLCRSSRSILDFLFFFFLCSVNVKILKCKHQSVVLRHPEVASIRLKPMYVLVSWRRKTMIIYTSSMHIWDWVLYLPYLWIDLFLLFFCTLLEKCVLFLQTVKRPGRLDLPLIEWVIWDNLLNLSAFENEDNNIYITMLVGEERLNDIYYFSNMANPSYMLRKIRFFPLSYKFYDYFLYCFISLWQVTC